MARAEGRARMVFWSDNLDDPPPPEGPARHLLA
jgi:hypothetical protein